MELQSAAPLPTGDFGVPAAGQLRCKHCLPKAFALQLPQSFAHHIHLHLPPLPIRRFPRKWLMRHLRVRTGGIVFLFFVQAGASLSQPGVWDLCFCG